MHFFPQVSYLSRFIDCLDRVFGLTLILFMVEITLVISIGVISRYFMNSPVYWAEEVTRYSFVWATFLGAACAFRRKELVAMSVLLDALSEKNQTRVKLVMELVIGVFLASALVFGIRMAMVVSPQLAVSTRVSMAWLYGVVPVSCFYMLLCSIENIHGLVSKIIGKTGGSKRLGRKVQ